MGSCFLSNTSAIRTNLGVCIVLVFVLETQCQSHLLIVGGHGESAGELWMGGTKRFKQSDKRLQQTEIWFWWLCLHILAISNRSPVLLLYLPDFEVGVYFGRQDLPPPTCGRTAGHSPTFSACLSGQPRRSPLLFSCPSGPKAELEPTTWPLGCIP